MEQRQHGMTQQEIDSYRERWGKGPHVAADLAVVSVPFDHPEARLQVLLIRRAHGPYAGSFALPGGFVEISEDLEDAARRELGEETGLADLGTAYVEQLKTYGLPKRDPRARVISVVFLALVPWHELKPTVAGDDASEARYFPLRAGEAVDEQGRGITMAFDHDLALRDLRVRLQLMAAHSSAPMLLLPAEFTLPQAQRAYEVWLERPLDPERFDAWLLRQRWLELVERPKGERDREQERHRLRVRKPLWAPPEG